MPGPLYYVVNGTTDGNGAASLRLDPQLVPLEWAYVAVVVACPGAPTITVTAGGAPIASGGGPNATIGGVLLPPSGGPVTLGITAAQAAAPVQVTVQGWSDPSPNVAQQMGGAAGAGGGAPSQIGAQLIDAPLDINDPSTSFLSGTVAQYGPFNCQTWASFIVFAEPDHQCTYDFLYFADQALSQGMSSHGYDVDGNNGQNLQAIVPNVAPFLVIQVSRLVAGPFTPNIRGFRSQRLLGSGRSTLSGGSMPVVVSSQTINAGNTLTVQGGGPVVGGPWWYRWVAGQAATFFVTAMDDSGNYDTIHLETLTTGSNEGVIDLPDSSSQWNVHNTSGSNGSFSLFAYPVPTGSR